MSVFSQTTAVVVNSSGNMGIGVGADAPKTKLDVRGDVYIPFGSYWIGSAAAESGNYLRMLHNGGHAFINFAPKLRFQSSGVDILNLNSNGNVGIGVYDPTAKLEVGGTIKATNVFASSAIGIGTTMPEATLDVRGNTQLAGTVRFANGWPSARFDWSAPNGSPTLYGEQGNTLFIGKSSNWCNHIYGTTIEYNVLAQYSDKRLKKNIVNLPTVSAQLKKISSYTYNYNELLKGSFATDKSTNERKRYGFLAQEVKEVFPDLVYTDDSTGYLKLDYVSMIPILLQAFNEQNTRTDIQQSINEDLNKQVSAMQTIVKASNKLIAQLEAQIQTCCANNNGGGKLKSDTDVDEITNSTTANATTSLLQNISTVAALFQNAPNPFKESTQIKMSIPETVIKATLAVYDLTGKQLKAIAVAGRNQTVVTIAGNELIPGMYHYALLTDGVLVDTKTMVVTE